ncbi:MAG: hypothetical protein LBF77_09055, partial [Spirochaetaceae bacterium]|nr:hypothetical protein [Spirochaetaceae bacterium]
IRDAILEECRNRKNSALPLLSWEMEQRREDLHQEIKRTLKIKPGRNGGNSAAAAAAATGRGKVSLARRLRLEKEIDAYIDLVWNELEALADRMAASGGVELTGKREILREKAENPPAGPSAARPAALQTPRAVQGRKNPAAGPVAGEKTAELEPVKVHTALLSRPLAFTPELIGSPESLAVLQSSPGESAAGGPVFEERNGITYINKAYTVPGNDMAKKIELDEKFKDLVDSVINDSGR